MGRQLEDWLTTYIERCKRDEPATIMKLWSGVSVIAGALQRKCWTDWERPIYPNFYIALIGPPAVRKSIAIFRAKTFLSGLGIPMAPNALTKEKLYMRIEESAQNITIDGANYTHNSLTVHASELSVFMRSSDPEFISSLTDLFDCEDNWAYETKGAGENHIIGPFLNILGGITPVKLRDILPETSVGEGFTSRVIFVYGQKRSCQTAFSKPTDEEIELDRVLLRDLEAITTLRGQFDYTPGFGQLYEQWYTSPDAQNPEFLANDHHFEPYLGRRALHLRKLAMVMCASRTDSQMMEEQDFNRALGLLEETETVMPNTFRAYGRLETGVLYERAMALINNAPGLRVSSRQLHQVFYRDATSDDIEEMIKVLQKIGFATVEFDKDKEGKAIMYLKKITSAEDSARYKHIG